MKKKRLFTESEISNLVFSDEKIKISKNGEEYFFEIGNEITSDVAEGVSIMMKLCDTKSEAWNLEIINQSEITPEKSLFWLTGGHTEWKSLENYNRPWCDCYLDFQEEFGILIINIIKRSKSLKDIKDGFNRYLNLPTLYDFAVSKSYIK
jgi:hypothetical protein